MNPLDNIRVATPCSASWDAMTGDDVLRFCGQCSQHVYDLSALTQAEAEDLIRTHEGDMCVRFYRRADGTMMTKDCPVGVQKTRPIKGYLAIAGALAAFVLLTLGMFSLASDGAGERRGGRITIQRALEWLMPGAQKECVMGKKM